MSWLLGIGNRYRVSEDPLRTLRGLELLALLLGLLLCLQLAWGGFQLATMATPEPVVPAADSLQVPSVAGPALVAVSERNEIITRPLFWSSRRPVDTVVALAEPEGKPGELKGVKLVGLFGSGDQAGIIALVKGKKRRILLGDAVEGWTLKSIRPSELVVANGERTETLVLQRGDVEASAASASSVQGKSGQVKAYSHGKGSPGREGRKQKNTTSGVTSSESKGAALVAKPESKSKSKPKPERTLGLGA